MLMNILSSSSPTVIISIRSYTKSGAIICSALSLSIDRMTILVFTGGPSVV